VAVSAASGGVPAEWEARPAGIRRAWMGGARGPGPTGQGPAEVHVGVSGARQVDPAPAGRRTGGGGVARVPPCCIQAAKGKGTQSTRGGRLRRSRGRAAAGGEQSRRWVAGRLANGGRRLALTTKEGGGRRDR
jgi:hypothetical protein